MASVQQDLQRAVASHRAGNLDEAGRLYRRVLKKEPRHAEALHLLGVVYQTRGDNERAVKQIESAIAQQPDKPGYHYNLALALQGAGRVDEARAAFEHTLELQPAYADAHAGIGILLLGAGDPQGALERFEAALRLNPHHPQALSNLGASLRLLGRDAEALEVFERVVDLAPGLPEGVENLRETAERVLGPAEGAARLQPLADRHGHVVALQLALAVLHRHAEDLDAAVERALAAVALEPDAWRTRALAGHLLLDANRPTEALPHLKRALDIDPEQQRGWVLAGACLRQLFFFDYALYCFSRAAELAPDDADAWTNLGQLRFDRGDLDGAMQAYERALELQPERVEPRLGQCSVLERQGDVEAARALAAPLFEEHSGVPEVAMLRAQFATGDAEREAASRGLDEVLSALPASDPRRSKVQFFQARLLDRLGRHAEAFAAADEANQATWERFDAEEQERFVDRLQAVYSADGFESLPRSHRVDEAPIFVVGLPRSGTTLVEQVLAAHPAVHAAGELELLHSAVMSLEDESGAGAEYPELLRNLSDADMEKIGAEYLDAVHALAPEAERIVDKMPENFRHIGFIARALPGARIVHCTRDLRDVGLSMYFRNFQGLHRYAHRLQDIAAYARTYRRLAAHWEAIGLPVHTVRYETLVEEPETTIRALLEHLELPWDPAVLAFHEVRRVVMSASYQQVRRPIYRSSVGKWRNYAEWLGPLLELEPEAS